MPTRPAQASALEDGFEPLDHGVQEELRHYGIPTSDVLREARAVGAPPREYLSVLVRVLREYQPHEPAPAHHTDAHDSTDDPWTVAYYKRMGWTFHQGSDEPSTLTSPDGDSQVTVREDGTLYDYHA